MVLRDPDTNLFVLEKQPWDTPVLDMEFKRRLRPGVTLSAINELEVVNVGTGTNDVTTESHAVGGTRAQARFLGGTKDQNYKVSLRATDSDGNRIEGDGMLYVRD